MALVASSSAAMEIPHTAPPDMRGRTTERERIETRLGEMTGRAVETAAPVDEYVGLDAQPNTMAVHCHRSRLYSSFAAMARDR